MTSMKYWVFTVVLLFSQYHKLSSFYVNDFLEELYNDELIRNIEDGRRNDYFRQEFPNYGLEDQDDKCTQNVMYHYNHQDTSKLLQNIEKIINFFDQHSNQIIVDGLFGMRAVEGVFKYVIEKASNTHPLYKQIEKLYSKLSAVCERIFKLHKRNTGDEYTQSFLKITEKPFVFQLPWKNFNLEDVWEITQKHAIKEAESDRCVKGMIGFKHPNCYVDKKCWNEEMRTGTKSYYLTHQILFLMAGQANGCRNHIVKYIGSEDKLSRWYHMAGSNIYAQMMSNVAELKSTPNLRDITVEQGMICQSLGIVECYRTDVLRETLGWLNSQGCVDEIRDFNLFNSHSRVKRVDVPIGRCSQHLTAVLMGFYANHLPFYMLTPPCNMLDQKDIFQGIFKRK